MSASGDSITVRPREFGASQQTPARIGERGLVEPLATLGYTFVSMTLNTLDVPVVGPEQPFPRKRTVDE